MLLIRNLNLINKVGTSSKSIFTPEIILSSKNREICINKFMKFNPSRQNMNIATKKAAVLIPLCMVDGELSYLYTLRSSALKSHSGQVSFPGGMQDEEDLTPVQTALRETEEELGISHVDMDVWCYGKEIVTPARTTVTPVLAFLKGKTQPSALRINKTEVEEAFAVPLERLCAPEQCKYTQFRGGFTTPVYFGGKKRIWGLTAVITHYSLLSLIPEGGYYHQSKFTSCMDTQGASVATR